MRSAVFAVAVATFVVAQGCAPCPTGESECGGTCHDLSSDRADCGACGHACAAGSICAAGRCVVSCPAGESSCADGLCHDLKSDAVDCGVCGVACPSGQQCVSGACACPSATPDPCGTGATAFCTALAEDANHCGTCDTACGAGQLCDGGKCVESCADGYTACPTDAPTYCAAIDQDANNCGACGVACASGQQCVDSACACPSATPDLCGSGSTAFCTTLAEDANHCGTCDPACGAGQLCDGGKCVESCSDGYTACPTDAPTYCAATNQDANNCGGCGVACAAGQQCVDSACACPSATPDLCGTGATAFCTTLAVDANHCGTCDTACGAGQLCDGGKCVESCSDGYTACPTDAPTYCAAIDQDANNCGGCGVACAAGQQCVDGACACPSATPNLCGSGADAFCTSFASDPNDCGACGHVCDAGEKCSPAGCVPDCDSSMTACDAACVDLETNPAHCGDCDTSCASAPNAWPACASATCGFVCEDGFLDCDASASNGCEVDGRASLDDCGACGNACPAPPHAGPACVDSQCGVGACADGYGDCNGTASDGCEARFTSDRNNCGTCGHACGASEGCVDGTCVGTPDVRAVIVDGFGASDTADYLRSWGYTATIVEPADVTTTFDYSPYDVIAYMFDTAPADVSAALALNVAGQLGIVCQRCDALTSTLDLGDSAYWQTGSFAITDASHYVTQPFAVGALDLSFQYKTVINNPSPNTRTLGTATSPSLVVHNTYRRIATPYYGHTVGMPWSAAGEEITRRSYEWASGFGAQ